ncbi:hypothetical protein C8J57DRAFT_1470213 [Mycena rebaudengoi]|nr:hypothetical protein C8J57DRAFT_1470213 [Mycena rebaudengoi]
MAIHGLNAYPSVTRLGKQLHVVIVTGSQSQHFPSLLPSFWPTMEQKDFVLATLLQSTKADIDDYKRWIRLPPQLAQNPAYSASNVLEWIKLDKFNDYLIYKTENAMKNATQPDHNASNASRITSHAAILPTRRTRASSVEAVEEDERHSFNDPLPLNGPLLMKVDPPPTPIITPVVESTDRSTPSRNRSASVEAVADDEESSFHPPLPLDSPILMQVDPLPTPIITPAPVTEKKVLRDIINLCTSESESEITIKQEPTTSIPLSSKPAASKPAGRFSAGKKIVITRKEKVDAVVYLSEIPARWPVSDVDTTYIVDFTNDSRVKKGANGEKPKGLDEFLKKEDQDSWGKGTNGSASRNTKLAILGNIDCRRSVHRCNGGHKCEFLDPTLLADYQRTEGDDMTLTREIFSRELRQNQTDSGSAAGRTASFFRVVQQYHKRGCPSKSKCDGVPVLKKLKAPNNDGKLNFIGCSEWVKPEQWNHTYAAIPADVDEILLAKFMRGSALPPVALEAHDGDGYCGRFSHPRYGKKTDCPHVHFRDGVSVTGKMVEHSCPSQKIVYTSKDPAVPKCVVIFRNLHSHPPWPMEKPGHADKEDVKRCMDAGGILGETGGHLNNSHVTHAVLGASLDVKHPAFRDTRRLRDEVTKLKSDGTPAGLLWAGILADYEDDLKLPLEKRYVHHVHMNGDTKIAVAMNPELAGLIHDEGVRYIMGDITFKRTRGEMNEWEAVIWYTPSLERLTVARIYTNAFSKEAFTHLFDAFFSTVKKVTGKPVQFKAFHPKGNLYSIHFDMEAAQVQGLGASLSNMVIADPALRALFPSIDPDKLVQLVVKLCSVHLERSTDPLVPLVGQETVNYLNGIRGLSNPVDIANWHKFCSTHENKKLRGDWHAHKVQYSWLLPGYNESLSSFPPGFWQQSPSHTNLVESAHVASNKARNINLLPVEAVRKARIFDAEKAASITAARETCILVNRHNQDQVRMARNVTRTANRKSYRQEHDEVGDSIIETQAELATLNASKKDAAARLKDLKAQKKDLGRVPRHSTSGRAGSSASIPQIVGVQSEDSADDEGQSAVEPDYSSSPAASMVLSSLYSSPGPVLRPLDEADPTFTSGAYVDSADAIPLSDDLQFHGTLPPLTDEEFNAFAATDFTGPNFNSVGFNFEEQWQAVVDAMGPPENPMSLPDVYPLLPLAFSPHTASSPFEPTATLAQAAAAALAPTPVPASASASTPPTPVSAPGPRRKRKRQEVDLNDVIDVPRARKVRVREY